MKISAAGLASTGTRAIRERKELYHAKAAISALHDGLMAVALGKITPEDAKEFFCFNDESKFIGGVLDFKPKPSAPAAEAKAVEKAMETLDAMAETWAEKVGLTEAVRKIKTDPDKIAAYVKAAYSEGIYLGRTSHQGAQ